MQLRELYAADLVEIRNWPPYPPEFAELDYALRENGWLDEFREKSNTSCFVVEQSGALIALTILSTTGANEAEFRIALRPDKISQGLGADITSLTLEQGFSRLGFSRIHLIVRKNNTRALRLYTQIGFVHRGECSKNCNGKQVLFTIMDLFTEKEIDMKRALLVIDVQNEYFFGKLPVSYPPGSMDNILLAMDKATLNQVPVIVIQHTALLESSPVFRKNSPEWALHPKIEKRHRETLIEKNWPDSFTETNLEEWLKNNNIDTLTVCGYMTQMCCDTTARRAYHLGYAVEFLSDATGTLALTNEAGSVTAEELHRAILVTQNRFSRVMTTGNWINTLQGRQ
ncbi:MAG: isochorismatase family protein [Pseudomonadota bacterium]